MGLCAATVGATAHHPHDQHQPSARRFVTGRSHQGHDKGLVVEGVKSWSIGDRRLNFQFACQYGRLIENGELGAVVKDSTYTGRTPDFWGNCDGVAGPSEWRIWGVPNCGKGEP